MSVEKKVSKQFKRNLNFCHLLKFRIIQDIGSISTIETLGNINSIVNQKKAKFIEVSRRKKNSLDVTVCL